MRVDIDDTSFDDGFTYMYEGEPVTGEIVETDPDGNVVTVIPVVDGVPNGTERAWYPDGTLRLEIPMVNGAVRGTSRQWHPDGRLAQECDFDDRGDLVAIREWTEDGTPVERPPGRAGRSAEPR